MRGSVALVGFVALLAGCSHEVGVRVRHAERDYVRVEPVATWRNQSLRFYERTYEQSLEQDRRTFLENALRWLDQQEMFTCPAEAAYVVDRDDIEDVEFEDRGESFTVFVGCCSGYWFEYTPEGYISLGRGDYVRID